MELRTVWTAIALAGMAMGPVRGEAQLIPAPEGLMCDLLAHPEKAEIFSRMPRFSWIIPLTARNEVQTAYRIRVAESVATLTKGKGCLWDSGKVSSDRSTAVA